MSLTSFDKKYSMDEAFLENINMPIRHFYTQMKEGDEEGMFHSVEYFEIICSPVVNTSKAQKTIEWLHDNFNKAFIYDETGEKIGFHPKNRMMVLKYIKQAFREIVNALEKEGIYTKKIMKMEDVMGKFRSG